MVATINTIYKSFQPASLCITTSNIYTYYYNMHHWLKSCNRGEITYQDSIYKPINILGFLNEKHWSMYQLMYLFSINDFNQ
jgi:hypothetical protein